MDKLNIKIRIGYGRIEIKEAHISDIYEIEQSFNGNHNGQFFVTSTNGYNGFEGDGFKTLEAALKDVKKKIVNHFSDRCEPAPCKGFNQTYNK